MDLIPIEEIEDGGEITCCGKTWLVTSGSFPDGPHFVCVTLQPSNLIYMVEHAPTRAQAMRIVLSRIMQG